MTPDHRQIVEQVHAEFPDLLRTNTIESCGRFTRRCAARLHEHDANWGLLTKGPGQTQYEGHAVDAVIYKATGQVVDIIAGAHNPSQPGRPAWSLVGRDPSNLWAPPGGVTPEPRSPDPPPEPGPEPAPAACTCNLQPLEHAVRVLRADAEALRAELLALTGEVEAIKTAWNRPWRVRGGTSRDAYHAHQIDLEVTRDG